MTTPYRGYKYESREEAKEINRERAKQNYRDKKNVTARQQESQIMQNFVSKYKSDTPNLTNVSLI
jgi:hypothetical protein